MNLHRYSPSSNPYAERLPELSNWIVANEATEQNSGHWRERFLDYSANSETAPELHLEIGCNAGHVLVEWAKNRPNERFIGLDWKYKQIFRAGEKARRANLKNILFFRGITERVPLQFGKKELSSISIFFPDPWEKNTQRKHRPFLRSWFNEVASLLKSGGRIHLKTDHEVYFDFVLKELQATGQFEIESLTRNLHEKHPNPLELKIPEVTLFERLFIKDGIPIKEFKARTKD